MPLPQCRLSGLSNARGTGKQKALLPRRHKRGVKDQPVTTQKQLLQRDMGKAVVGLGKIGPAPGQIPDLRAFRRHASHSVNPAVLVPVAADKATFRPVDGKHQVFKLCSLSDLRQYRHLGKDCPDGLPAAFSHKGPEVGGTQYRLRRLQTDGHIRQCDGRGMHLQELMVATFMEPLV